jgi:deoxyribodipyrimidine photo-lyase
VKSGLPVQPLFIFDQTILDKLPDNADPRVNFIYRTLRKINQTLNGEGSGLLIEKGDPAIVWQNLLSGRKIVSVYTNHDYEPSAIERDKKIRLILQKEGISFKTFKDQVIFEKNEIVSGSGQPYTVYTPYMRRWRDQLKKDDLIPFPSDKLHQFFLKRKFNFPLLEELGFKESTQEIPGKEINENLIRTYDETRNFPALDSTSRLGIHLRFGTISIRDLVQKALYLNEVWLQQLIWREFFMMILFNFPHVVRQPFREKYTRLTYLNDQDQFTRWCQGNTGYPLVDAGMRELNATGFMHNRVRMVTASFLAKHLLIDWRWGEHYFAEKLLDYELASNNGNWQWAAGCGCDAAPYFRIFNPAEQAKKFDPEQVYIKKWIPEIGTVHYPQPMIDHHFARQRALSFYEMLRN